MFDKRDNESVSGGVVGAGAGGGASDGTDDRVDISSKCVSGSDAAGSSEGVDGSNGVDQNKSISGMNDCIIVDGNAVNDAVGVAADNRAVGVGANVGSDCVSVVDRADSRISFTAIGGVEPSVVDSAVDVGAGARGFEFHGVGAGYNGREVLHAVSFTAPAGALTALVGVNGCGKSTLIKAAARLIKPTSGEITLEGRGIFSYGKKEFARAAAYLPQTRPAPDVTVRRLAEYGRFPYTGFVGALSASDRAAVDAALEEAGIAQYAERPLRTLSGGERQRAYIAAALAQGADAILLDEPTAHLDIGAQFDLIKLLLTLAQNGRTIVAALHELPLALAYADKIVLLRGGSVGFAGAPSEALESGCLSDAFGVDICPCGRSDTDLHGRHGTGYAVFPPLERPTV